MPCYSGFPRQSGRDAVKKKKERKRDSNRRKEVEEYTDKGIERKRVRERERVSDGVEEEGRSVQGAVSN